MGFHLAKGPLHRSVVVYIDNLHCFGSTFELHMQDAREVHSFLRQEKLYVKASNSAFGRMELVFLGHQVSSAGAVVDPHSVARQNA
jgi:hypothetical protein